MRAAQAGWIWWATVLGGILFLLVIVPVVVSMAAQKGVSGFGNRFKAAMSSESQATRTWPSGRFILTVGPWNYLLVVAAFLILFLSWVAGQGSASNQSVYFRLQSTHDVLVAVDGETLIFEGYSGHTLTGQLRLVSTGPDHQVSMIPVKVGPLGTPTICVYKEC